MLCKSTESPSVCFLFLFFVHGLFTYLFTKAHFSTGEGRVYFEHGGQADFKAHPEREKARFVFCTEAVIFIYLFIFDAMFVTELGSSERGRSVILAALVLYYEAECH